MIALPVGPIGKRFTPGTDSVHLNEALTRQNTALEHL